MRAIYFENTGMPDKVLKTGNFKIPEPNDNEVRVRVLASPINPADILFINGQYRAKPLLPQIAGLEGAGLIDKVGKNVSIPLNSLVSFRHKGTWAEYTVLPIEKIIKLPDEFPIEKASQFSLNPFTAYALLEQAKTLANEWILLTAGNSAVSKIVIQMARSRNINTIAIIRDPQHIDDLKRIGATEVFTSSQDNLIQNIFQITDGKGVKCILDSVGGNLISGLINGIENNGQLIIYGLLSKDKVEFHNSTIIFKNIKIKGFGIDQWLSNISKEKKDIMLKSIINALSDNRFEMPVTAKYSFDDFNVALETNQSGSINGKVLLTTNG